MMRRIALLFTIWIVLMGTAQELPQFAYNNYEGWTYNNPGYPLNPTNIGQGKISIYVNSEGVALMLTSPVFSCQDLDSIQAIVTWKSRSQTTGLTMALDNADGVPLDSLTSFPASSASEQKLSFTLPVPVGLANACVRFVSWEANVNNCGAIRVVSLTGITTSQSAIPGDVDGDGNVSIADVTVLIDYLLGSIDGFNTDAADVDGDGHISISDVTALIDVLLSN